MKKDWRDYLVMLIVTAVLVFGTVFLVKHPTDSNFMTWAALVATVVSAYHWINMTDDKRADINFPGGVPYARDP